MKAHKRRLAIVVRESVPSGCRGCQPPFYVHQIEGFLVDENIRFSDLKGILELFAKSVFGRILKCVFVRIFFVY